MMDGTCATCQSWERDPNSYNHPHLAKPNSYGWLDEDQEAPMPGRWGRCIKADGPHPASIEAKFVARDHDEHSAWMMTREDFGCVDHEPKAEEVGDDDE